MQFVKNFEEFTQGQLKGMDWSNVFVAGGCVLACMMKEDERISSFKGSDIDLFFYGMSDEQARNKLRHILDVVTLNRSATNDNAPEIVRTPHAVTIVGSYPFRHIQIVLRMYVNPAQVIIGFDVDSCSVGFDGSHVFATPRARRSLNKRYNLVDMTRRSLTYEVRLHKYAKRGFAVMVPGLRFDRVSPDVRTVGMKAKQGLARLLALDELEREAYEEYELLQDAHPQVPPKLSRKQRLAQKKTKTRTSREERRQQRKSRREATKRRLFEQRGLKYTGHKGRPPKADWSWLIDEEKAQCDYSDVLLPWGPSWHNWDILKGVLRKDKAQLFSSNKHRHIAVSGVDAVFRGKAEWCTQCAEGVPIDESEKGWLHGELGWLHENPGTQLMTASFHPVSDEDYEKGAYVASTDPDVPLKPRKTAFLGVLQPVTLQSAPQEFTKAKSPVGAVRKAFAPPIVKSPKKESPLSRDTQITVEDVNTLFIVRSLDFNAEALRDNMIAFDLEGTLVTTASGKHLPQSASDWKWMYPEVPQALLALYRDQHLPVVIMANYGAIGEKLVKPQIVCERLVAIFSSLHVPFIAILATQKNHFFKPATGMFLHMTQQVLPPRCKPNVSYCGSAAGREKEFVGYYDRAFAANIHAVFHTPEAFFLHQLTPLPPLPHEQEFARLAQVAIAPGQSRGTAYHRPQLEVVVLFGGPSCGKSTFARKYLCPHGYVIVNQDAMRTRDNCAMMCCEALSHGASVVIDGCNYRTETRKEFIELARKYDAKVRCISLDVPAWLRTHLNHVRTLRSLGTVPLLPDMAFATFDLHFVEPQTSEGFDTVEKVEFVPEFENAWDRDLFFLEL